MSVFVEYFLSVIALCRDKKLDVRSHYICGSHNIIIM